MTRFKRRRNDICPRGSITGTRIIREEPGARKATPRLPPAR
jgi:hypothetical protein